jgi:hypothetical protein
MSEQASDPNIELVLAYMGVTQGIGKRISYEHWYRFLLLTKRYSGQDWEKVRNLMRSYVNVDKRYLDDYLESCQEWGTVLVKNNKIVYVGLPKGVTMPKGKPFPYGPPPERDEKTGGESE